MASHYFRSRYRILKISLAAAGAIIIIVVGIHLWFVNNARTVLKQYITEQSGGKIKVELAKLDLNLLTQRLQIHKATLFSTDSLNEPITYGVTFSRLSLKVGSVWKLLFQKQLLLDSLKLYNPVIEVVQWRKDTTQSFIKDELSIPQEMGKVYNSMIAALNEFGVRRIVIDNAKFSLINKIKPGSQPVVVSNIFFDLARTPVKQGAKNVYVKNEHTIELRSADQNIVLPGGRHRISFKSFDLHLFRQSIELDSCTLTAVATDSIKSSYKIFFKKILLTGVDFNALSTKNLIKADSVYCEDPSFNFDLFRADAIAKKTEVPDPGKIIRELAGNLNLAYVGIKNAGIQMDIHGKTNRSFYNSNKDNFEIRGLRINPDSSSPVSVARFDMILKDYLLFNEDSTSVYSFDSLHFLNNKIILNNFAVSSRPGVGKLRNLVDIQVPFFSLTKLDWYQLIFEQNLVASEALLTNPVINFTRKKKVAPGKKLDLFNILLNVDSLVSLNNVSVTNGQINMQLGPATSFKVQNIDFNILSNRLLRSTNQEGLSNAVEHFSFSRGILRIKDITAQLVNARFTGDNLIYADKVNISGKGNRIKATINNAYIDNMVLDDDAEAVEVDGLGWKNATVAVHVLPSGKGNSGNSSGRLHLKNVEGNNSQIHFSSGATIFSTFVKSLIASSITKKGNDPLRVEGFRISGNDLNVNSKGLNISADVYRLSGSEASALTGVQVVRIQGQDTLQIQSPQIRFTANLNDIIANNFHFTEVSATSPVIKLNKWDTTTAEAPSAGTPTTIRIDKLSATEPDVSISTFNNDSVTLIKLPSSNNSSVNATAIVISGAGTNISSLLIKTTSATFVKPTGEILGVEKGKIDMDLSDIQFGKKSGKLNWSGYINSLDLQNANGLQMGRAKKNLLFQNASLGNLNLSSDLLPDFSQLLKKNVSAWLRIPQGQFIDSNSTVKWYNAAYSNSTGTLSLDSFVYHPTKPLDTVLKYAPYQLDYITVKSGGVNINGLDVERYEKDSSFIANTITIADPVLTVYRDKMPPLSPFKKDKPLPVNIVKNVSWPVAVQKIDINDGLIIYAEKNGKSRKEGTLFLNNVDGTITNIKNSNFSSSDSLTLYLNASLMDAAHISLNLKESYIDTLSGFLLNAKIAGTDLSILNRVLVPLSNVKIVSGVLDSISFRAVGRQDVALGEMNMHYQKLRIKLVKAGNADETTFLQNVISVLANTFVIKRANTKRKGVMYYQHSSKQSFVNYIVKITLSGIMSSVGAKKNSKFLKQYKQALKKSNLEPINL
ncbi:MAG TPA: hypothetical protein VEZ55_04940 [Chitinophagaceae bacterium]|nr:hypothetical protein [Chitinophagaceae bacterium]